MKTLQKKSTWHFSLTAFHGNCFCLLAFWISQPLINWWYPEFYEVHQRWPTTFSIVLFTFRMLKRNPFLGCQQHFSVSRYCWEQYVILPPVRECSWPLTETLTVSAAIICWYFLWKFSLSWLGLRQVMHIRVDICCLFCNCSVWHFCDVCDFLQHSYPLKKSDSGGPLVGYVLHMSNRVPLIFMRWTFVTNALCFIALNPTACCIKLDQAH